MLFQLHIHKWLSRLTFTPRVAALIVAPICQLPLDSLSQIDAACVPSRVASCRLLYLYVLCNTLKQDRDAVTQTRLDSIPGRVRAVCLRVGLFRRYFFFQIDFLFLIYCLPPSVCTFLWILLNLSLAELSPLPPFPLFVRSATVSVPLKHPSPPNKNRRRRSRCETSKAYKHNARTIHCA